MHINKLFLCSTLLILSNLVPHAAEPAKFFPVMPWNYAPNDKKVLAKIRDCGFTVAGFVTPKTLETCQKLGIKGIVQDPRIYNYDWTKVDPKITRSNVLAAVKAVRKN